ncbi:hypothetical protein DXM21_25420 [Agrobacterium rosae]|nr:hypothetical protein DXM21_25420 [Agrobacterium rosae]KAA3509847.1 hypothetical protein DXM25_25465 [Agrobacterium rosae]MQB51407.1 hypothetical protein [Agrobacterium rosae]
MSGRWVNYGIATEIESGHISASARDTRTPVKPIKTCKTGELMTEAIGSELNPAEAKNEAIRKRYEDILIPIFFSETPTSPDIKLLFSSVLRVTGMEDRGWDPHAESRAVIDDLYGIMQMQLPEDRFKDPQLVTWRVGLMFYSHIIEMSAPYEVLANLMRYRLGNGYHPNPFFEFLTKDEKKRVKKMGVTTKQKIRIVKELSDAAGFQLGTIIDEFYRADFRNAIAHSDFIFTDNGFRCRASIFDAFSLTFEQVDDLITSAKLFIGVFFSVEREFRRMWGAQANRALGYDPVYKGMLEILSNDEGMMEGFKVHWPNGCDSWYRRTNDGIEMTNITLELAQNDLGLFVGNYPRRPDPFSPVVAFGEKPVYTPHANGTPIVWSV